MAATQSTSSLVTPLKRQATKVVLSWINLGPYHVARARALSKLCELTVVEFASIHRQYGWTINRAEIPFEIRTLLQGAWEDQSPLTTTRLCWKELNRLQPDVLIIPGYAHPPALAMALRGCLHRAPRILMSESTAADRPRFRWKEKVKGLLITTLYSAASFGGQPQLRYLEQLGFDRKKSAPFYNVVDNDFFTNGADQVRRQHVPADFSLPQNYFLYVGRLAPEKNLTRLLKAFATYRSTGGNCDLVLAGDGPLRQELSNLAEQLQISAAVRFAGRQDAAGLIPYYAFASSFILPSLSEPWGLVVNEALACGLPVMLSTKCGCAEDLVDIDKNGFLFDPTSEPEIADCLTRMAALSETERASMCAVSSAKILQYSPESWASALLGLIGTL